MSRDSYIKSPRAQLSCALIDELTAQGIAATVGYGRGPLILLAYAHKREDVAKIPKTFKGYPVQAGCLADIEPLESAEVHS